jgi:hypothetical protein
MRMSKEQEIQATNELLAMLANDRHQRGQGLRTSEMCGTPAFHGGRTLSLSQIARLLRKSGKAARQYAVALQGFPTTCGR